MLTVLQCNNLLWICFSVLGLQWLSSWFRNKSKGEVPCPWWNSCVWNVLQAWVSSELPKHQRGWKVLKIWYPSSPNSFRIFANWMTVYYISQNWICCILAGEVAENVQCERLDIALHVWYQLPSWETSKGKLLVYNFNINFLVYCWKTSTVYICAVYVCGLCKYSRYFFIFFL